MQEGLSGFLKHVGFIYHARKVKTRTKTLN